MKTHDAPNDDDLEIGDDLEITKTTRRAAGAGTWVIGTLNGHRFDALVFPLHAECPDFELDHSRISKLWIKGLADGQVVCNFDRGWAVQLRNNSLSPVPGRWQAMANT